MNLSGTEESKLIAAAKNNLQQFDALYELYVQKVYRYFMARFGKKETAEDLTSQTFLKAIEGFDRYTFDGKPFGVWLFRIAHNLRIDFYRQQKTAFVELDEARNTASNEDIEDLVHTHMLYTKIEQLLREFSEEEKEILLLKLSSGLKFSEIAAIFGKSENTIKTKYFRNLKILQSKADTLVILITLLNLL